MEKAQNRVLQDRRRLSRLSVQMECRLKSEDKEYGALMLDLSQGGTLISSTLPPSQENLVTYNRSRDKGNDFPAEESKISITLEAGSLKGPMTLSGTIKRSSIGMSEYGKVAQFGVEFENTPLELLRLISKLSARRKPSRAPAQMECLYRLGGEEYQARIIELSLESALLYSAVVPVRKSKVFIIIEADNMESPLTIEGMVTRTAASGQGEEGQFEVEFEAPPPELRMFINALSA